MKEIYAILSIKIVFSIIGLLLHGVGIYTLKRNKWNNQVIILINLSTAEIILLINFIISDSMGFMEQSNENNTNLLSMVWLEVNHCQKFANRYTY